MQGDQRKADYNDDESETLIYGYQVAYPQEITSLLRFKVLSVGDLEKKADSVYVKLKLKSESSLITQLKSSKIKVMSGSYARNPKAKEQSFIFRVKPSLHQLVIEIFAENTLMWDGFLGQVTLSLGHFPTEQSGIEESPELHAIRKRDGVTRASGYIELYHAYIPKKEKQPTKSSFDEGSSDEENDANDFKDLILSSTNTFRRNSESVFKSFKKVGARRWSAFARQKYSDSNSDLLSLPDSERLSEEWSIQVSPSGRPFFINHREKITTWVDPRTGKPTRRPSKLRRASIIREDDIGPLPEGWVSRVHSDGRIYYIDHKRQITQWEDPRITQGKAPTLEIENQEFNMKYRQLKYKLVRPKKIPHKCEIQIRRKNILQDSFEEIMKYQGPSSVQSLKAMLWVVFDDEGGLDYGGISREWFLFLSKELFNPSFGLFEYAAEDQYCLQINPNSSKSVKEHLKYFRFTGRIFAMAIFHGYLLEGHFINPLYKMLLRKEIDYLDLESIDIAFYKSVEWIVDNDPSELELSFQVDEEFEGQRISTELKPGGADIKVEEENKEEYINLLIEWKISARVRPQKESFLVGFEEIFPLDYIRSFNEKELELLIMGSSSVDVRDWKRNTSYLGDYYPNHIVIQWFWRIVLSFDNEQRAKLLQFVTGTSRIPINGFQNLDGMMGVKTFAIQSWGTPNDYPKAHTCFNRLDLPPYESYHQLKDKLRKAILNSQGFCAG